MDEHSLNMTENLKRKGGRLCSRNELLIFTFNQIILRLTNEGELAVGDM
jgi:hypothetical protein